MFIGSNEHKELFCRTFKEGHRPYDPRDWPWPALDDISLARLRAIPIWTMAIEVEIGAGVMLSDFAKSEPDPIVREALNLQAYEEDRHGRILQCMIDRYGLNVTPDVLYKDPNRRAFVDFGYDECVDSFAGFGIFRLARDARILPESLTSLFSRVLVEESHHIVFFTNWIAWDRSRRGLRWPVMQAIPALASYGAAIARRVRSGAAMQSGGEKADKKVDKSEATIDLFGEVLSDLTPVKFLRACVDENDRYMAPFDQRLLRPRVIPTLGRVALAVFELIEQVRSTAPTPRSDGRRVG